MAKKPATATADKKETAKGKKGIGWRYCPECDHSTKGPRSTECANCGKEFPQAKGNGQVPSKSRATPDTDKTAMQFILWEHAGSLANAKKALTALAANPAMEFAVEVGGIPQAIAALERVGTKPNRG